MLPLFYWVVYMIVGLTWLVESFTLSAADWKQVHHLNSLPMGGLQEERLLMDYKVHLYSLKWSSLEDSTSFSKIARDTWRWKDQVLGDGRDFFVPRPKTLKALQDYILDSSVKIENSQSKDWLSECIVLSNCARFEIIVVTTEKENTLKMLAECLVSQIKSFQNVSFKQLQSSFDRPGNINSHAKINEIDQKLVAELAEERHWNHLEGTEEVCRHLCMIAAGMADRPSRPGRPVPFQPFSSRDAHVLLQLKRTLENARSASRIALMLRYALLAGKTVRNPDKIIELQILRQYGTGNTKYDSTPPPQVLEEVTQVVIRKGIDPTVEECLSAWNALDTGRDISSFRERALSLAQNEKEKKWVTKKLHEPTIQLRKGEQLDQGSFLADLQTDLVELFR